MHPVKSVAASPQQVSLLLAQPEHLEQGPENTESASKVNTHQAINGQYLKECSPSDLLSNAISSNAEVKNRWSYAFSPTCAFMVCVRVRACVRAWGLYVYINWFNKNCEKKMF